MAEWVYMRLPARRGFVWGWYHRLELNTMKHSTPQPGCNRPSWDGGLEMTRPGVARSDTTASRQPANARG